MDNEYDANLLSVLFLCITRVFFDVPFKQVCSCGARIYTANQNKGKSLYTLRYCNQLLQSRLARRDFTIEDVTAFITRW